jgi:hypothetical protein
VEENGMLRDAFTPLLFTTEVRIVVMVPRQPCQAYELRQ